MQAKDDPALLQTFINTVLAEGWRDAGEEVDDTALAARAEEFSTEALPMAVLTITAGVDVQRDRLEVTLIGWDQGGVAYVLGHRVIWGRPDDNDTWRDLDDLLKERFRHPFGGMLGIEAAAVDSGDGETMERVYRFCFPRARRRIMAIKGVSGNRPWIERSKSKVQGGWLWIVGTDSIKAHLVARLARGATIRFSNSLSAAWYEQLASERVVVRYSRGQPARRFERIPGRQAEALDCTVYAIAARQQVNVNWCAREEQLRSPNATAAGPSARPRVIESDWLRR
jgi:phage terminase large subunit GpA-like protein